MAFDESEITKWKSRTAVEHKKTKIMIIELDTKYVDKEKVELVNDFYSSLQLAI